MNREHSLEVLRQFAISLCPDLGTILSHDSDVTKSTWKARTETGKAIEVITLCGLVASFRSVGLTAEIPTLFQENPDLFYLRNVIPTHHAAQPGNSSIAFDTVSLRERFLGALTPKVTITHPDGRKFLIFREGHPIQPIISMDRNREDPQDRPDIIITEGSLEIGRSTANEIEIIFTTPNGRLQAVLRIKNSDRIPLVTLKTNITSDIPIIALVECSARKSRTAAETQLKKYLALFDKSIHPSSILINGPGPKSPAYDFEIQIDACDPQIESISSQFSSVFGHLSKSLF